MGWEQISGPNLLSKSTLSTVLTVGNGLTESAGATTLVLGVNLTFTSASLGADVNLNNITTFFDGPSVAQGSAGTWFVSGSVTVQDTAGAATIVAKLWDGTNVIDSGLATVSAANGRVCINLSGCIASPAGNLRISVKDGTSTNGQIVANQSTFSKDSTITAIRIV